MKNGEKTYNSIDLCKIIMAICVVAIHTHPLENCSNKVILNIYESIVNCAVPFFFLASGYLLAIKLRCPYDSLENIEVIKKYLLKIVKMYVVWTIIYSPIGLWFYWQSGHNVIKCFLLYLRGFLLIGENYNSNILWYLLSTIYALIFVCMLLKIRVSLENTVKLGVVIILCGFGVDTLVAYESNMPAIMETFCLIIEKTIVNGRILRGFFFIPCGMLLAYRKQLVKGYREILVITFIGNCIVDNLFFSNILILICSVSFFSIVVQINLNDAKVFPIMRELSTVVYLIHLYVWMLYYTMIYGKSMYGMDCFIMTVLVSLVLGGGYIFVKEKFKVTCIQK